MTSFLKKRVMGDLTHRIEFSAPTLAAGDALAGDMDLLVQAASGDAEKLGARSIGAGTDWIDVELTGGARGAIYLVTVQAETTAGRHIRHSFVVGIERSPCVPME